MRHLSKGQINMFRTYLSSAALLVLMGSFLQAGHKVEVVPAEAEPVAAVPVAPASKRITLSFTDQTLDQIIAGVEKELGVKIRYDASRETRGPTVVYDLSIDAADKDEALDQFAKSLRMNLSQFGEQLTLQFSTPVGYIRRTGVPAPETGPARVSVLGVRIARSIAKAQLGQQTSNIELRIWPGPLGMRGLPTVTMTELIDDQDRVLTVTKPESGTSSWGASMLHNPVEFMTPFDCPTPRPKSIKRLRGRAQLSVPASYDRLSIDAFDTQPIECTLGGIAWKIGPLTETPTGWSLPIRHPAKLPKEMEEREAAYQVLVTLNTVQLTGPEGERMRLSQQNTRQVDGWMEYTYVGVLDNRAPRPMRRSATQPTTRPKIPMPSGMVWNVPRDFSSLDLPIEADNLPVP